MRRLDLTMASPAANLAMDEALLDLCETDPGCAVLRFWEPDSYFVVVGYANKVETEVDTEVCRRLDIPVLRRCSGGGTVLQGPGCLDYSIVVPIDPDGPFSSITATNKFIMEKHRAALESGLGRPIRASGVTDLTIDNLKFSGNSQRRRRNALIFHGVFLLDFDLGMIGRTLRHPSKEPEYREGRPHERFLINLKVGPERIKAILSEAWKAGAPAAAPPDISGLKANTIGPSGA